MGWRKGGIHPPISCRDRKESLKRLRVFLKFLKPAEGGREEGRDGARKGETFPGIRGRLAEDIFSAV